MTMQREDFKPRNTRTGGFWGRHELSPFRVFGVFRGSGLAHHEPDTMPNYWVGANRRPAAPPGAGQEFGSPFSARASIPAAVAHLSLSALLVTSVQRLNVPASGEKGNGG
jgi:hypothetical protein